MTNYQLKFPYSEEEEKELFAIRRRFQDEPVTSVIVQEYQTALKEQTSLTAVAAQEELARRGDYNYIGDFYNHGNNKYIGNVHYRGNHNNRIHNDGRTRRNMDHR